jgi:hypothetical protein
LAQRISHSARSQHLALLQGWPLAAFDARIGGPGADRIHRAQQQGGLIAPDGGGVAVQALQPAGFAGGVGAQDHPVAAGGQPVLIEHLAVFAGLGAHDRDAGAQMVEVAAAAQDQHFHGQLPGAGGPCWDCPAGGAVQC